MNSSLRSFVLTVGLPLLFLAGAGYVLSPTPPGERDAAGAVVARRPNIVFISVDTLRADHLRCYGYPRKTSPRIDAFAARSVRFAQAFSQASWTLPSHMSMMTSQYPHVHGVQDDTRALPESATTLAETLSLNGYRTAAFVSWVYLGRGYGFAQGFDEYNELLPPEEQVDSETSAAFRAEAVTDEAVRWLQTPREGPFFLFVHYFDPHISYEAPAPFGAMFDSGYEGPAEGTFAWLQTYIKGLHHEPPQIAPRDLEHVTALYDGEIRYTDVHLGRLFAAIERSYGLENTVVILTSDHGEELNEHGSMEGHQWTLYEEVLHVPLIMHLPGDDLAGTVVSDPVELIDVAPTLLALLGLAAPMEFQGRDLNPAMEGTDTGAAGETVTFAEIDRFNRKQCVRTRRYKLIYTDDVGLNKRGVPVKPGYELYDLQRDPKEQVNLFDAAAPLAQELVALLEQRRARRPEQAQAPAAPKPQVSLEAVRRLQSVGYIGAEPGR